MLRDDCVILRTGVVVLCKNDATDEVTDDDGDCDAYDGKAFKSLTGLEGIIVPHSFVIAISLHNCIQPARIMERKKCFWYQFAG